MTAPQSAQDVIGRAIHEHDANASMGGVEWPTWDELDDEGRAAYESVGEAILDALTAAGYAIVKLPEPSRTYGNREAKWTDRSSFSEPGYLKWSVGVTEGGIPFASARRGDGFLRSRAAADHAAFAAAILAAAAHAEAGEQ